MFDIAWGEFLVIGVVALIVIGPKELPGVLRAVGQWTTKIRRMAGEFQSQFQEALREAEMADLKKEVDTLTDTARGFTSFDPIETEKWQPKDASATAQAEAAASSEATASGEGETKPWEEEMAGLEPPFQSVTPPPEPPPPPQTAFGHDPLPESETIAADSHARTFATPPAPPLAGPAPSRVSEPVEPAPEKSGPA